MLQDHLHALRQSLQDLTTDTLNYLNISRQTPLPVTQEILPPPSILHSAAQTIDDKPPITVEILEKKPTIPINPQEKKHTPWPLTAPKVFTEPPTPQRFASLFPNDTLHIPVQLWAPLHHEDEIFFCENVCKAITRQFFPAVVLARSPPIFDHIHKAKELQFLMTPLSLLQSHLTLAKVHEPIQYKNCLILPLYELKEYLQDIALKRTLWNLLKTHFANLPLSA